MRTPTPPRLRALLCVAMLGCATVSACSDGPDASPTGPATNSAAGSPTAAAAATEPSPTTPTSPSPASTAPPPLPREPTAARSQTPEAAAVFISYYVALLDRAYRVADATALGAYEGPDCAGCRTQATEIGALRKKGQRAGGPAYTVDVGTPKAVGPARYDVPVTLTRLAAPLLDASGAGVGTLVASTTEHGFILDWTGMGWQVTNLRPLGKA